jgi:protein-tyrosine phosphatase
MIDIHSHLLPGVDDGSPSVEASIPVLERFGAEGVEVLVCTPHLNASEAASAPYDRHVEILESLQARAPATPRLALGWEIMLDEPGVDLRARHLGLAGSTAVLVEFPRRGVPASAGSEIARLRASGLVPVLAHPERYWGCTVDRVREWKRDGAVIQVDAIMLGHPSAMGALAAALLSEGLVDCIASDNHGDARTLGYARRWLEERGASEQARLLTHTNAARLLADEPVLPVAPIPLAKGLLSRLKRAVFRGKA